MPVQERRQHLRIDDRIYFDYRIITPEEYCSDLAITNQLLGDKGKRFMEAAQYFQEIDHQIADLTPEIAHPSLVRYLTLLNEKIDYLSGCIGMISELELRKVNLSLGGMAFKTSQQVEEKTHIKVVLYTKPKMIPIVLDGRVVYSQYQSEAHYRTSIQFNDLTSEQEQLLSQHILLSTNK